MAAIEQLSYGPAFAATSSSANIVNADGTIHSDFVIK